MKKFLFVLLAMFLMASFVHAADVTLTWDANTEPDLTGYKIYQADRIGNATGAWAEIDTSITNTYIVVGIDIANNYAWLVSAYDSQGNESFVSNMVELYDRTPPGPPINLDIQ